MITTALIKLLPIQSRRGMLQSYIWLAPDLAISKEGKRGYSDALIKHGVKIYPVLIIGCAYEIIDEGFKVTEVSLKNGKTKSDAIFANNDMAAVDAMLACRSMGIKVPEDIGIVGFCNWQFCSIIQPSLTSCFPTWI